MTTLEKSVVREDSQREGTFFNADGRKIYCRYWNEDLHNKTNPNPNALVFIAHGAAEHCLWYTELAECLISRGCYVFGHDHVGHGQSEGDRVHIDDFNHYVRDVLQHVDEVKRRFPYLPVFIIGHSMGGTISIAAAMQRPTLFQGVVLIGPAVVPGADVASPVKILAGKIAAMIVPQAKVIKLDPAAISRDTAMVQKYKDDPLVYHGGLKAKWGVCFLKALETIKSNMDSIEWPFLALHGELDRLCEPESSRLLYEKAKSKDKQLKIYPSHFHQLHNEPKEDREVVKRDIMEWIVERIKPIER